MTIRQEIIAYLEANPNALFSPAIIAYDLGLNPATVRKEIRKIANAGVIEQTDRGYYVYFVDEERPPAHVYMFKGFSGGSKWFLTYTTDHELSKLEIQRLILSQSGTYGNIELVSEGTSTEYESEIIGKWEYEDTGEES